MKFVLVSPKNRTAYNFRGDLVKLIISNAVILAVAHEQFKFFNFSDFENMFKHNENKNVLIDIKGMLNRKEYENARYIYWRL